MTTSATWWQPQGGISWQWQLAGKLNTNIVADVYDVDVAGGDTTNVATIRKAHPNAKLICYVNVGSLETDGSRADEKLFLPSDKGARYPGWPKEVFVDIRSDNVRRIMQARFETMKNAGCDGIEPDNMAIEYKGTGGFATAITQADQYNYITWFAEACHNLGLAIGAKNGGDLLEKHPELFKTFDFAVVEECVRNKNCGQYSPFVDAGKPVFAADYLDAGSDGGCSPIKGSIDSAKNVLNAYNFEGILKNCKLDAAVIPCKSYTPAPPSTQAELPATTAYIPKPPTTVDEPTYVPQPPPKTSDTPEPTYVPKPATTQVEVPVTTTAYVPKPPTTANNDPTYIPQPPPPQSTKVVLPATATVAATTTCTSSGAPGPNVPTTTVAATTVYTAPPPQPTTKAAAATTQAATSTYVPPPPAHDIATATTCTSTASKPPAGNTPTTTKATGILANNGFAMGVSVVSCALSLLLM